MTVTECYWKVTRPDKTQLKLSEKAPPRRACYFARLCRMNAAVLREIHNSMYFIELIAVFKLRQAWGEPRG